ncbi:MAG: hypothetical protein LW688_09650 [Cryomorphaceae bacterium]|jgi:hypothetical protein|nr:hypothetical protein [Cryomorphaceae bacterium]
MIAKILAAICFSISFLVSIILFTGYGAQIVHPELALLIFLFSGGIALVVNFVSYQTGKHDPKVNFYFWLGSIVVFLILVGIIVFTQFIPIQ